MLVPNYCTQCGNGIIAGARFCSQCGIPTQPSVSRAPAIRRGSKAKGIFKWIGIGCGGLLGLLIIIMIVGAVASSETEEDGVADSSESPATPVSASTPGHASYFSTPTPTYSERISGFEQELEEVHEGDAWGFQMILWESGQISLLACVSEEPHTYAVRRIAEVFVDMARWAHRDEKYNHMFIQLHRCRDEYQYVGFIPYPESTEGVGIKGLLKGCKGAPLNLG